MGQSTVFEIDPRDPTPLYAQLERVIRTAIATGRLPTGGRLPTVRQLAVDLRINANTVARVYAAMERAGLLETRRGVGTFVAAPARGGGSAELRRRLDDLGARYLAEASALGFSARESIAALEERLSHPRKRDEHGEHPSE